MGGILVVIKLEPLVSEDLKQVIEWNKNSTPEFLLQWSGEFEYPLTREQLDNFYHFGQKGSARLSYKIIDLKTSQTIGIITIQLYREKSSGTIVKFLIGEENMRGKGIGHRTLKKILHKGFTEFGLRRIKLFVYDFNTPAIRCYKKVHFEKDRLLKGVRIVGDNHWNMLEMSIFEDAWRSNTESHCDA
jgi:RimJ/RimL family protein N-acetyltransferase